MILYAIHKPMTVLCITDVFKTRYAVYGINVLLFKILVIVVPASSYFILSLKLIE